MHAVIDTHAALVASIGCEIKNVHGMCIWCVAWSRHSGVAGGSRSHLASGSRSYNLDCMQTLGNGATPRLQTGAPRGLQSQGSGSRAPGRLVLQYARASGCGEDAETILMLQCRVRGASRNATVGESERLSMGRGQRRVCS